MDLFKKCDICRGSLGLFSKNFTVKDGFVCEECFTKSEIHMLRKDASVEDVKSRLFKKINKIKSVENKPVPPRSYSVSPKNISASEEQQKDSKSYVEYVFPERLNNKQKLYKTYNRMNIDKVSLDHAEQLSYSEPLRLKQLKSGAISLYHNNKKIGEVSSRGQDMTNQFLSRGDTVVAFIAYASGDFIKVSYGYYRDYRKNKTADDMPSEKELFDYIKDNTKLSLALADKKIELPFSKDNRSVCFIENNYNICIITTEEPDYNKLVIGNELIILKEPDNPHDKKAIKIMQEDIKLGYFYSHNLQDEVNKMLSDGAVVKAYLTQISPKDQYSKLRMSFVVYK